MFRTAAIFLLTTFLSLGSNCFEQLHLAEVNRALAQIPVPKVASRSPLKRLPVKPPVHDPATCAICIALHAPLTMQGFAVPTLNPAARLGYAVVELPFSISVHAISHEHCRGPPAV